MNTIISRPNLQNIPFELQTLIFKDLREIDLSIMSLTCRQFNSFLKEDVFWEKSEDNVSSISPNPNLSKKEKLLQDYREYCRFFFLSYPELQKDASFNVFEQKKRTDGFLETLFKNQNFHEKDGVTLAKKVINEKPKLINLFIDAIGHLSDRLKLSIVLFGIPKYSPLEILDLLKKLNFKIKNYDSWDKNNLLNYAAQYTPSLIKFFLQEGAIANYSTLALAARYAPSEIPLLLGTGVLPNLYVLTEVATHAKDHIETISNLLLSQGFDSNLISEVITTYS